MIKTSGYRVSPTEIEEVIYASGLAGEVVAVGAPHPVLGECIVVIATPPSGKRLDTDALLAACKRDLPAFMVPAAVHGRDSLPRNANGKIDRVLLAKEYAVPASQGMA
jgi:acyl-CoA synthetase (AMP-forming)/AMP-acid ligase II